MDNNIKPTKLGGYMNYYIFIDETGNFIKSKNRNTNYVGGWVCGQGSKRYTEALEKKINQSVQKYIQMNNLNIEFPVPDYLHFIPLHLLENRKKKDAHIQVPFQYVQPILSEIFSTINNDVLLVFRSTGFPYFCANDQAVYIEILRATLHQLIDDLNITARDKVEIVIAERRLDRLMGLYGIDNPRDYENSLSEAIKNEMLKIFALKQLHKDQVNIFFSSARKNITLAVADLFCGALRWKKYNYLEDYHQKIKRYSIHNAFIYIPNRTTSIIDNILEHDPGMGLLLAFEALSNNQNQEELIRYVNKLCKNIDSEAKESFNQELRLFLKEKLVDDPTRYQNLDQMSILIQEIEKRFNEKYIIATLKFYRIKIMSHMGSKNVESLEEYCHYLELYGPEIFGNMYIVAQEKIEAMLTIVHPAAFNIFKFERVEDYLSKEIERYETIFPDVPNRIDETRARLEGTIGQMYGFLSDYPGNEDMFEFAEEYLKLDVSHCRKNSRFWYQGMGYLTSLYYRKRMLDKAIDSFMIETNSEKNDPADIFNLSKLYLFKSNEDDYFLLHRLYLCALANKVNKTTIKSPGELMNQLLENKNKSKYPIFLSVKWLSVIYAQKGDIKTALNILKSIDIKPVQDGFAVDVTKLPIKLLVHLYKKKQNLRSSFDLDRELNLLEEREKGIKENLISLGIQRINEDTDYFDVAQVLPFYYS